MPTDFNGSEPEISPAERSDALFVANPVWERGRKRRTFGARRAAAPTPTRTPEPRSFTPTAATMTPSTLAAEPPLAEPATAPIRERPVRTTRVKSSGISPLALGGAVAAVAVIGIGGWYMTRPHDGVPTLAPGQPTTSEVAVAPVTSDTDIATNTLPERAPEPVRTASAARTEPAATPRVRPARAAAPSAEGNAANASAILPDGPQPYAKVNPAAAPAAVTPAAPPPVEAAPPAAIPTTPPVQADPAPAPTETPTPPQ